MLEISDNIVHCENEVKDLDATRLALLPKWHLSLRNLLWISLATFFLCMFLPWQQNIQATGQVTTLRPQHRPQTIPSTIPGRIEKWYVMEGQAVKKGDTIVYLSEVKDDYFDPSLIDRTGQQVDAKRGSIDAYGRKAGALEGQIDALRREKENKLAQLRNKIQQGRLKLEADSLKTIQADIDIQIAQKQFNRADSLYTKGIKSLTEWENKRIKLQDARTKRIAAQNNFESTKQDLIIYDTDLSRIENEYNNKIAKAQSDRFSALSSRYEASATVSKLEIQRDNYTQRASFYYILAPQDGFIVKAIKPGIGEIIKEGTPVVTILPSDYELAVEMYVKPVDLPLIDTGRTVRFMFDGWPAFVFSGWPGVSTGTYSGKVVAIDRTISTNGRFRVLVAPDKSAEPWPEAVQVGSGARGIAMLNTVRLWYELWRVLNAFPPDLYDEEANIEKSKEGGFTTPKAPIKNAK